MAGRRVKGDAVSRTMNVCGYYCEGGFSGIDFWGSFGALKLLHCKKFRTNSLCSSRAACTRATLNVSLTRNSPLLKFLKSRFTQPFALMEMPTVDCQICKNLFAVGELFWGIFWGGQALRTLSLIKLQSASSNSEDMTQ